MLTRLKKVQDLLRVTDEKKVYEQRSWAFYFVRI